jgi:hypothetical protein
MLLRPRFANGVLLSDTLFLPMTWQIKGRG